MSSPGYLKLAGSSAKPCLLIEASGLAPTEREALRNLGLLGADHGLRSRLDAALREPFGSAALRRMASAIDPSFASGTSSDQALCDAMIDAVHRGRIIVLPDGSASSSNEHGMILRVTRPAGAGSESQDVSGWSYQDRTAALISMTPKHLPAALAQELLALIAGAILLRLAAVLAAWAASHLVGIGFVIDVIGALGRGHRDFFNPSTGDRIRFDPARPGAQGHAGRDHYHQSNPARAGSRYDYLDRNGNPVVRGSDASHLYPGE
jgi:hypothetical protein